MFPMRKRLSIIVWGGGLVLVCILLGGALRYRKWKQSQRQRLQSASCLLETSRGTIEYHLEGTGPTILVLHGSPGGYDQGMGMARALNLRGFSLLSFSRPGYRRTPLSSGQTPEAQADLFASALDALNVSQVRIIAFSGGGPSAVQFALRYPQRCRGLLMISAVSQRYSEEAVYRSLPAGQRWLKRLFDLFMHLVFWDPFLYLLGGLSRYIPGGAQSASLREALEMCVMNPLQSPGCRNDVRQCADLPPSPCPDIAIPMLIVHGTADRDVPFSQAQELARANPAAQLVPIEGANHFVLVSEQATTAIQRFLQNLPSGEDEETSSIHLHVERKKGGDA